VHGSLILGGYDTKRFVKNNVTFPMNPDDVEKKLRVAVQSIILSVGTTQQSLLADQTPNNGVWATIDTTAPYLYLPQADCNTIARAFQLIWEPNDKHYLFSNSTMNILESNQASLNITIGTSQSGPNKTSIIMPWTSLALTLRFPYIVLSGNESLYFPIRPATSPSQYTLGRAFLQDAYLIADYERSSFSVHDVAWLEPSSKESDIKTIAPGKAGTTFDPPPATSSHALSKAAIGAIAGGVCGLVIALLALALLCLRRRRAAIAAAAEEKARLHREADEANIAAKVEDAHSNSPGSLSGTLLASKLHEADSHVIHESSGLPTTKVVEIGSSSDDMGFYWKDGEVLHEAAWTPTVIAETAGTPPGDWNSTGSNGGGNGTTNSGSNGTTNSGSNSGSNASSGSSTLADGKTPPSGPPPSGVYGPPVRAQLPGLVVRGLATNLEPASPIPETPHEFYGPLGRNGPGPRVLVERTRQQKRQDRQQAAQQQQAQQQQAKQAQQAQQQQDQPQPQPQPQPQRPPPQQPSRLNVPAPAATATTTGPTGIGMGSPPPASPIPETPLEFYGGASGGGAGRRGRDGGGLRGPPDDRDWVGRAPGLPEVTLTPATPASATASGSGSAGVGASVSGRREMRPPVDGEKKR
jgi:hypothetical protein